MKHPVLRIAALLLAAPVLFIVLFIICGRIIGVYYRDVVSVALQNSLEGLEQVRKAEVELTWLWLIPEQGETFLPAEFDVELELLSGDKIYLEYVHKDMTFCKPLGLLRQIDRLAFVYGRTPISGPGLPIDLLQIYMHEDFSSIPLFLDKYSEIKKTVTSLPSVRYSKNEGVTFDEIDYMGQDSEGRYFRLFKTEDLYIKKR